MRRFLISLLLASAAATPAIAGPREDRQQAREERQQARGERQAAREEHAPARVERAEPRAEPRFEPRFEPRSEPRVQVERAERAPLGLDARRAERETRRDTFATPRGARLVDAPSRIEQRREDVREARELRQATRPTPRVFRNPNPPIVSTTPRPGTQPPAPAVVNRTTPPVQWNTHWRNNGKYDWQNHRRRHRSWFHLGVYYDPFGWGYYPYQIGWRLWPSYYSSRYWIHDPWYYRLPYAPAGYRWIRYWNDALLVDTWTGEVVDVVPNFFW